MSSLKTWEVYQRFVCRTLHYCYASYIYRVAQTKRNSRFFRTLLWSTVIFFTLLDRASFPHYNNTKIIQFDWELFILWAISYGLSFSGFARFLEFPGTINDSFGVHKLSEYCVQWSVYCLTRIYNPGTSLALRFLCSWLNAGANTCVGACTCCWSCH